MDTLTEHQVTYSGDKKVVYYDIGPREGPLLIFCHGWPSTGRSWLKQLTSMATLGFRAVAPDMPGCGQSTSRKVLEDYTQEAIVEGMLALIDAIGREQAVWVGHDWGAGVVWSFVRHHPERCRAVINLSVPYATVELGLEEVLKYVNREIHPKDKYPWGQWSYMAFYEQSFDDAAKFFDDNAMSVLKTFYAKSDNRTLGKPPFTANVVADGGWFGGPKKVPRISPPEAMTSPLMISDESFQEIVQAFRKTGFFGADAYYAHHKQNRAYNLDPARVRDGGVLHLPVLFIEGKFDSICDTAVSRLSEPQRRLCKNLTEVSLDTGHWIQLEEPEKVNAVLARFIATEVSDYWPGYWSNGFVKNV